MTNEVKSRKEKLCREAAFRQWGDPVKRFWGHVERSASDQCWKWKASRIKMKNGKLSYGKTRWKSRRDQLAHRVAWELINRPIPEGMNVCHKCDNPPCCNPANLFIGTNLDNVRDKITKGRLNPARGQQVCGAKLKCHQIPVIRLRLDNGITQKEIAKEFGVNQSVISHIKSAHIWRHV